jgi:transcription antitermination factor NusG
MFHGQVAVIQPTEIELLRRATDSPDVELLPDNQYHSGEEILINDGLFAGYQGTVVHTKEHSRVAVRIHELGLSLVVTVPRLQVCAVALHETE